MPQFVPFGTKSVRLGTIFVLFIKHRYQEQKAQQQSLFLALTQVSTIALPDGLKIWKNHPSKIRNPHLCVKIILTDGRSWNLGLFFDRFGL